MGRIMIWALALLFGYVSISLAAGVFVLQSAVRDAKKSLPSEGANIHIYDSYYKLIPGIKVPLHLHTWAAVLVGIGFGLVVLGLVFLLHVPVKDPM